MSLRKNRLDDTAVAELDAVDAALRGDDVAPEHADLATLVADVRDTAPQATPAFLAELDARVREGFPERDEVSAVPRARRRKLWILLPAAGGSLAAAVVAVMLFSGPTSQLASEGGSQESVAPAISPEDGQLGLQEQALLSGEPSASTPESAAAPQRRSIEQSATLGITVPADEVSRAADEVTRITERERGVVQRSVVSVGDGREGEAQFELRVPTDRIDAAIAAFSDLGRVTSRTQDTQDITREVRTAEGNVSQMRSMRRAIERRIRQARARGESTASLRRQLASVRRLERKQERALASERARATMATVAVTITGGNPSADDDSGWSVGDAAGDAGRLLEVVAGALIVGAAVVLPLLLLALGGAALARALVRRRRERGLDAA